MSGEERSFRTLSGEPVEERYSEPARGGGAANERANGALNGARGGLGERRAGGGHRGARSAGPASYPFTRGIHQIDVPRPAVDDAPVRGLRHGRGDERALPLPARARPDGPLDGVRHAVADGPRLRPRRAALGEVGREGVAIDTLDDMQTLFAGIDLGEVSVSMTINAPGGDHARVLRCRGRARAQGGPRRASTCAGRSRRTSSRSTSRRRSGASRSTRRCACAADMIEWCTRQMPRWHPISISGYHIREAGVTAAQELAFTLKDGLTYVEQRDRARTGRGRLRAAAVVLLQRADRLLRGDRQVPRRPAHLGARDARDASARANPRSWLMRFHTQTAGVSLTAQQPLNNIVRTTIEALAAVLGGTQSLHTNSYDEALALPTEEAVHDRAAHAADDRARDGRHQHRRPARRLLLRRGADRPRWRARLRVLREDRRARRDGQRGQAQLPPARDRRRGLRAAAGDRRGERVVVGVNRYTPTDEEQIPTLRIDPALERKQIAACRRRARHATAPPWSARSPRCARTRPHEARNLMEPLLECARAHASEGEIVESLQQVFGDYTETPVF